MIVIFIISLAIIIYYICLELDEPIQGEPSPRRGACPSCRETVEGGWLVCPHCRTMLRESCPACARVRDRWAAFCPWCGATSPEATP